MAESPPPPFGHEPATIAARPVLLAASILAVAVLVTVVMLYWSLHRYVMPHQAEVAARRGAIPPLPRLQAHPPEDLAVMRSQQQALLSCYTWLDSTHTVARIPIQRAMDIYVREHAARGAMPVAPDPATREQPR